MIFELSKPLYDWRNFADEGQPSRFDLELAPHIVGWLDHHKIKYDAYSLTEQRNYGDGNHTYIIFYIDVWDDKDAMLFKLTWL